MFETMYKDFKMQKTSLKGLLIAMVILFLTIGWHAENVFKMCTMIAPLIMYSYISVSTTYDKFYKAESIVYSLPVEKSEIALAKYMNYIVAVLIGTLVSALVTFVIADIKSVEFTQVWSFSKIMFGCGLMGIICNLIIPIHLKYGLRKGKIILVIMFGVFFGVYGILHETHMYEQVFNSRIVMLVILGVFAATLPVSFLFTKRILERDET